MRQQINNFLLLLLFVTFCYSCKNSKTHRDRTVIPEIGLIADSAMVVSAREEASKIGVDILKQGGNAFDAMMATEMALAVTFPFAGNLGGGGFMVYRLADGKVGALDYREKAPLGATETMYLDQEGNVIPNKSTIGAYAVGVPGTIAGIFTAQKKYGKLPIDQVLQPVIELAENGFTISERQHQRFKDYDSIFRVVNGKEILYTKSLVAGSTLKNIALANTLRRIVKNGKEEFYLGETASIIVNFLQERGGIIDKTDLEQYEAIWRNPVTFNYDDLRIISMSPPASGGICMAQIMKMVEPFDLDKYGHNSTKAIQVLVEAERRSYADRSYYLGDPDFVDIPAEKLISDSYLKNRMGDFSFDYATSSSDVSHGEVLGYESMETTHYSIVDQFGNAVSVTTTLNGAYGSKLYIDELGFFLNNEMDDFSSKPGVPNMFGLIGAEANKIEPGKRMLSSMTPTIVEKNDNLYMVLGTPGGSTIITSVLQTILNVHEYDMNMQQAVSAPRFHHQWLPDVIYMEPRLFNPDLISELKRKGYNINEEASRIIGKVDAIKVLENGKLEGGADPRGDDTAKGF